MRVADMVRILDRRVKAFRPVDKRECRIFFIALEIRLKLEREVHPAFIPTMDEIIDCVRERLKEGEVTN